MEGKYRYNAFISYRHKELDRFVAENLHKQLEAFRLPKSIAKKRKGMPNKIERVFRDKEELPLTSNLEDPIMQALQSSEWLIVICTPRLRESLWCKKEIETFIQLHDREHVLAVLAEGEPSEAFPDELLYKIEKHILEDGTVEEVKIPVEPLAADMRGKNKKEVLKAMKTEILRLLAAMFEMPYDDLRQRHRERRMRRILTATAIGGAVCLLFGIYSTATAIQIKKQNEQIEAQSAEIKEQSDAIKLQSEEIAKQNTELAYRQAHSLATLAKTYLEDGNRVAAINTAVEALTISDGIELPYTAQAQMVLTESVRAYDTGNSYKAEYQFETAGRIESIVQSPDADTLLIKDDTGALTLFDLQGRETIKVFAGEELTSAYTFLGENYFVYEKNVALGEASKLMIYDLAAREVIQEVEINDYLTRLYADKGINYLVGEILGGRFVLYDGTTFEEVGYLPETEGRVYPDGVYVFDEGILAYISSVSGVDIYNREYTLHFVDLNTKEMISSYSLGNKDVKSLAFRDGVAYMAAATYADYYSSCDSYVLAIEVEKGQLLWETTFAGYWTNSVELPADKASQELLFTAGGNVSFVNMKTGDVTQNISLSADVAVANPFVDSNGYMIICEDGEMLVVTSGYGSAMDMSRYLECATTSNEQILWTKHGVVVLERNDRKVTVYTVMETSEAVPVDKEIALPEETESISVGEAVEIATSYQIDKPEYVSSMYYSDDKKYCFIYYWDNTLVIYDVENNKVCNTIEDCNPTRFYMGKDAQGCTYLLGYYGCYVLNKDMESIAWIPNAVEVDIDNQKVYIEWSSNYCYEMPIYSLEQLIKMGQNYRK